MIFALLAILVTLHVFLFFYFLDRLDAALKELREIKKEIASKSKTPPP
jgi:hypothetical protein